MPVRAACRKREFHCSIWIAPEKVHFIGRIYDRASLASYSVSFAFLVIAFLSPVLSSIADYKGNKKRFMQFFCYMGSLSCCAMYYFEPDNPQLGIVLFILASIGFGASLVFYNAYLPEIAAVFYDLTHKPPGTIEWE